MGTQKLPSVYKRHYKIDLSSKFGAGKQITVQVYKEFIRVTFNGDVAVFGKSVGLLGDYKTGKTVARDGVTVMHDFKGSSFHQGLCLRHPCHSRYGHGWCLLSDGDPKKDDHMEYILHAFLPNT